MEMKDFKRQKFELEQHLLLLIAAELNEFEEKSGYRPASIEVLTAEMATRGGDKIYQLAKVNLEFKL